MAEVVLALGSNQGDRGANLARAISLISREVKIKAVSSAYETEPMYVEDQPWFMNCVVVVETKLPPLALLQELQSVEAEMGRHREMRYGPRLIDLDMIFYGDRVITEPGLEVPHPKMAERAFVLTPLAEVRPNLIHPLLRKTVSEMLADLESGKKVRKVGPLLGLDGELSPQRP